MPPPDLEEQIRWVHRSCEALGVPVLVSEGFEADDVIGTLALKGAAAGFDVVIVTGDKDFYQLVGGRSASSIRAMRAPGTTKPASSRNSACRPAR